jgi:hypothetical protein
VKQVIERLRDWGGKMTLEQRGTEENIVFALPRALRRDASAE